MKLQTLSQTVSKKRQDVEPYRQDPFGTHEHYVVLQRCSKILIAVGAPVRSGGVAGQGTGAIDAARWHSGMIKEQVDELALGT